MNNRQLYEQLMALRNDSGDIQPDDVVTAATPKAHPLHGQFEWDNRIAGHQYRLSQAQSLIRSVVVLDAPLDDEGHQRKVRAIISVPTPAGPRYRPTEEVAQDALLSAMTLREFERDWRRFKARWEHLTEFISLIQQGLGDPAA